MMADCCPCQGAANRPGADGHGIGFGGGLKVFVMRFLVVIRPSAARAAHRELALAPTFFSGQLFLRILRANVLAHGWVSRRTNQAGLPLRPTQRPGFLGFQQVAINHGLDCVPSTVGPLDGTMLCQLCLSSLRPSLRCLLTGERLGFLVD